MTCRHLFFVFFRPWFVLFFERPFLSVQKLAPIPILRAATAALKQVKHTYGHADKTGVSCLPRSAGSVLFFHTSMLRTRNVHTQRRTRTRTRTHAHTRTRTRMHTRTHARMHTCTHACTHARMHAHACTRAHAHTRTRLHIHTQMAAYADLSYDQMSQLGGVRMRGQVSIFLQTNQMDIVLSSSLTKMYMTTLFSNCLQAEFLYNNNNTIWLVGVLVGSKATRGLRTKRPYLSSQNTQHRNTHICTQHQFCCGLMESDLLKRYTGKLWRQW